MSQFNQNLPPSLFPRPPQVNMNIPDNNSVQFPIHNNIPQVPQQNFHQQRYQTQNMPRIHKIPEAYMQNIRHSVPTLPVHPRPQPIPQINRMPIDMPMQNYPIRSTGAYNYQNLPMTMNSMTSTPAISRMSVPRLIPKPTQADILKQNMQRQKTPSHSIVPSVKLPKPQPKIAIEQPHITTKLVSCKKCKNCRTNNCMQCGYSNFNFNSQ